MGEFEKWRVASGAARPTFRIGPVGKRGWWASPRRTPPDTSMSAAKDQRTQLDEPIDPAGRPPKETLRPLLALVDQERFGLPWKIRLKVLEPRTISTEPRAKSLL